MATRCCLDHYLHPNVHKKTTLPRQDHSTLVTVKHVARLVFRIVKGYYYENLGAIGWGSQEHFFSKNHQEITTLVITKLILQIFICLAVWLALFLYHLDHPEKHHQQIRLTKQISKSPLVLIRWFWIFTGIYQRPNRLPMLETSATVTGQPWCALILPPSQLPQSRNAISQWRPRLCQWRPRLRSRKKHENTLGNRKKRRFRIVPGTKSYMIHPPDA